MKIVLTPTGVLAFRSLGGFLGGFVLAFSYGAKLDDLPFAMLLGIIAGLVATLFGWGDFRRRTGETVLAPIAALRSREFWIGLAFNAVLALVLSRVTDHGVNAPVWALGMTLLNLAQGGRLSDAPNPYYRPWGRRR